MFIFIFYNSLQAQSNPCGDYGILVSKIVDGDTVKIYCKCVEGRLRYDSLCVDKSFIDKHIPKIERRLESTRKELNNYLTKLPELVKSLEEWGSVASKARKEAFSQAANLIITIFLIDKMIKIKEFLLVKKAELKAVESFLNSTKLPVNHVKELAVLRKIQYKKELLKYLSYLKKFAKIKKIYQDKTKFFEALALAISVVTIDPRIKLAISGGMYSIAVGYAWKAGKLSTERVEQLLDLSEQDLISVQKLSELYVKDIDDLKNLKKIKSTFKKG